MPRLHAARILMVASLLLMTLLLGFPAGRGFGAVSHAGQPTLGEVQQKLDQCRSRLAEIKKDMQTTVNLLKQAKSGARVLVPLPQAIDVPVDITAWQALITLDLFEGKISPSAYAKLQAEIKQWQADTVDLVTSYYQAGLAKQQGTQQMCIALERQRNQLLGGATPFTLVPGLTKVVNTHPSELTIDPTADTATEKHCCDGGAWDATYTWKVPDTVVPGTTYQVETGIQVNKVKPEQQLGFQISVLAPDFAQSYSIEYPHPSGGTKTFDVAVASDQSGAKEYTITIGFVSSSVTYTYRP